MVYFPSVAWVPLAQPINSLAIIYIIYYMVIRWFEGGTGGNGYPHVNYHMLTLRLRRQ